NCTAWFNGTCLRYKLLKHTTSYFSYRDFVFVNFQFRAPVGENQLVGYKDYQQRSTSVGQYFLNGPLLLYDLFVHCVRSGSFVYATFANKCANRWIVRKTPFYSLFRPPGSFTIERDCSEPNALYGSKHVISPVLPFFGAKRVSVYALPEVGHRCLETIHFCQPF